MSTLGQRIFAASGAILFFVTSIALTVVVIITVMQEDKKPANSTAQTTACEASGAAETLPAPDPFIPPGAVESLEQTDLQAGTGPAAKKGDCLVMKYYGTLATTGAMFDENFTQPTAFAFTLGEGKVIQGWDQGLIGIKEGGTRRLVIPANLAYGEQSPSEKIPANSALVFIVKLVKIK